MLSDWFFLLLSLSGGAALFLYGMRLLSKSLSQLAGGEMERLLKKMTKNRGAGILAGIGVTAAVQSSSAITVLLVGLVNAGLLSFTQTVGVLFGSNIGTTLTAWLFSLVGVADDSPVVRLLKPASLFPILALWGMLLIMRSSGNSPRATHRHRLGHALFGLAILFCGMEQMSRAVTPLADANAFSALLDFFASPPAALLLGAVFTAIIQSSSASIGILQALAVTGRLPASIAIPMIFGQNIGTCVTTLLAAIGTSRSAKRVAAVHIAFNTIGALLGILLLYLARLSPFYETLTAPISAAGIALAHSFFNIGTTILLLPFASPLEGLVCRLLPEQESSFHS